ncbi:MAG TPA: formate--tetrahydrofolate ligase [Thermodesulfobacteriota bacterium]
MTRSASSTGALEPIAAIARKLGLEPHDLEPYGHYKAKVPLDVLDRLSDRPDGTLVLVTAMTPTPAGEGKSTTTIGLGDGLRALGHKAAIALREPSLGPVFGVKGGATGGGRAMVEPMDEINLHFTGDLHAITTATNLLAAMVDNALHHGTTALDPRRVTVRRAMDMNERVLRHVVVGLGGRGNGVLREAGFDITAASEVMAILCLAQSYADLKARLARIVVGEDAQGRFVTAGDLRAAGAMAALLRDALKPNLAQTREGTPAFIHGGPFGNIAHGCNSVVATRLALKLADYVVTEAGFASDLGAEKFVDIKCRAAGLRPAAAVVVATVRALKMHGGVTLADLKATDVAAVERGLANLEKHVENVRAFGLTPVVALNDFVTDAEVEREAVIRGVEAMGAVAVRSEVGARGGAGGEALARAVVEAAGDGGRRFAQLYPDDLPLAAKIETVARTMYGADGVAIEPAAARKLARYEEAGYGRLPICIAKTQNSLSDDPTRRGRPTGFRVTVRDVRLSAGAGFVVALAGDILTMPGLPERPAAEQVDLDESGRITGLF